MRKKKRSSDGKLVVVVGNYGAVVVGVTIPTTTVPFLLWLLRTAVATLMRIIVDSYYY